MWYSTCLSLLASYIAITPSSAATAPGSVNCRYTTTSGTDVNYYTCKQMSDDYYITVEKFFLLNPTVDKECSNIKSKTEYCVEGCMYMVKIRCTVC